jgi:DNA invertase Pin-like site-specific DNA recombinase
MISERTKAAMAAGKARGAKYGRPNLTAADQAKGNVAAARANREAARAASEDLAPRIRELRGQGKSLQAVADQLNAAGHHTRRNKAFSSTTVYDILVRFYSSASA